MKKRTFNLAVETAIFLNDIAPTTRNKIPAYELWNNKPSHWKIVDLKEFGRIGIVKIKDKYVKKWNEKGTPMIMVGYVQNAPAGTYRMFNPKTKRVISSDSITWTRLNDGKSKEI